MTNGEMIQQDFECEVCEPITEDDIIHVIFADKPHSAIGFDLSWWNMEYKEPTTKNDLADDCISRTMVQSVISKSIEYKENPYQLYKRIESLPSVTPQPRKGHWIRVAGGSLIDDYCCDCCNHQPPIQKVGSTWGWDFTDYCPNCGAKMVEPQEREVEDG